MNVDDLTEEQAFDVLNWLSKKAWNNAKFKAHKLAAWNSTKRLWQIAILPCTGSGYCVVSNKPQSEIYSFEFSYKALLKKCLKYAKHHSITACHKIVMPMNFTIEQALIQMELEN